MTVLLLHDLAAEDAGEPWRSVSPEGWVVPDLPGHGATPAPRHGAYDPMGPVTLARWALGGTGGLVVGVGQNAHGALILAAGAACDAVAIVDGLGGPWKDAELAVDEMYAGLRRLVDDEPAIAAAPSSGLDPRTRYGYGVTMSPAFAQRFWAVVGCPVLAIETPSSTTPPAERAERLSWFGGPTTLFELPEADAASVIDAVSAWWDRAG